MSGYDVEMLEARAYILAHGTDEQMDQVLEDIVMCDVRKVVRQLDNDDISGLSDYMPFPQKKGGGINITESRKVIEKFITNHPAFRSQNSDLVCLNIEHFYSTHPASGPIKKTSPVWKGKSGNSTPSSPRIHQPQQQQVPFQPQEGQENGFFDNRDPYNPV